MKKMILLFGTYITVLTIHAQVTPYTGGDGSGYSAIAVAATACPLYEGGVADGFSVNTTPPAVCPPFLGGAGDGYDMQNLTCSVILPLKIISFYGEKEAQRNVLHWKVADEFPVKYFDIEKSADGSSFTSFGRLTGSTSFDHLYLFIDNHPNPDINFYRLRITGGDNKITYSRILLMRDFYSTSVKVYPDPAIVSATLYYEAPKSTATRLTIYQYDGRVVSTTSLQLNKGANYINIDVQHFANGLYFISIGETADRIKLMVLRK